MNHPPPPSPISQQHANIKPQQQKQQPVASTTDIFDIWCNKKLQQGASSQTSVQQPIIQHRSQQSTPQPPNTRTLYPPNSPGTSLSPPPLCSNQPPNRVRLNTDPTSNGGQSKDELVNQLRAQLAECQAELSQAKQRAQQNLSPPPPPLMVPNSNNRSRLNTADSLVQQQGSNNRVRLDTGNDSEALTAPIHNNIDDSRNSRSSAPPNRRRVHTLDLLDANIDNSHNYTTSNNDNEVGDEYYIPISKENAIQTPTATNRNKISFDVLKDSTPIVVPNIGEESYDNFDNNNHVESNKEEPISSAPATTEDDKRYEMKSIIDQMKSLPKPEKNSRGLDDAASDVSSLTDAVSYHDRKEGHHRRSVSALAATNKGSAMAALLRKPKGSLVRRVVSSTRNRPSTFERETSTTNTTTSSIGQYSRGTHRRSPSSSVCKTLETIDNSLEQHLYEYSAKDLFDRMNNNGTSISRRHTNRGHRQQLSLPLEGIGRADGFNVSHEEPVLYQSPLDEAIAQEKKLSSSFTRSQQHYKSSSVGGGSSTSSSIRHHGRRRGNQLPVLSAPEGLTSPDAESSRLAAKKQQPSVNSNSRIHPSWLTSSTDMGTSPGSTVGTKLTAPTREETPPPADSSEDLIDISYDEPVDPFSGLIGMPPSIGCESSVVSGGTSSTAGWNVFGNAGSLVGSPIDEDAPDNDEGPARQSYLPGSRPPIAKHRARSALVVQVGGEFDPLQEEEAAVSELGSTLHSDSISSSPMHPTVVPPRHHKDDPLLSKSRYRHPLLSPPGPGQQQQPSRRSKTLRHQRSSSLGASGTSRPDLESACMFGSIAQLEAHNIAPLVISTTPMGIARNISGTSLEWGDSASLHSSAGHSLGHNTSGTSLVRSIELETTTPKYSPGDETSSIVRTSNSDTDLTSSAPKLDKLDEVDAANNDGEEDDDSYASFGDEYNRPEQKHKGVVREVKHIMKPLSKVGRKLLKRGNDDAAMKRADGCLT